MSSYTSMFIFNIVYISVLLSSYTIPLGFIESTVNLINMRSLANTLSLYLAMFL